MSFRTAACLAFVFLAGCSGGGGSSSGTPASNVVPVVNAGASPTPAPTPTSVAAPTATPSPPAAMASAYALEAADITAYANGVAAQCPASPAASTRFDLELLDANANYLVSVLPGKTIAQAQAMAANALSFALAAHKALPGIGFMINPNYPVLVQNQSNAPAWWNASANYPVFAAYYSAIAQGLAQNGIAYDVETNLVFPAYSGQNYSNVTIAQLESGVAEDSSNVLTVMPGINYLNFASEPLTLSQNTGQPALNSVSGYTGYVTGVRAAIVVPNGTPAKIGAGSADWSSTAFQNALLGVGSLQFNDLHLYPPDVLATAGGGIAQVNAMNPNVTGKPGIVTENWDEKDAGNAGTYGAANPQALEAMNTYSFWGPLDAQYITATMRLARCQNLSVVSFWYANELFAYLDYATASVLAPTDATNADATAGAQAAMAGTLSTSGAALYTGLTGRSPSAIVRSPASGQTGF